MERSYEEGHEPKKDEEKEEPIETKKEEDYDASEDFPEVALPTDYRDKYEQHVKNEEKAKKEDAEELIRDYKGGFDFGKDSSSASAETPKVNPEPAKTPEKPVETPKVNPEPAKTPEKPVETPKVNPEPAKTPEKPVETPKVNPEPAKTPEKPVETPKVNSEQPVPAPITPEKSKAEKIPEKLSDEQYEDIKRARRDLDAVKNYQKKHTGLLQRLGLKKNEDAEVDKDLKERQKAYDDVILRIMKENGMMEGAVESAFAERKTKELLTIEREKIERQKEKLEPEKGKLFEKVKKVLGNKYVQLVIGTAILGVAIAAPPVGFLNMFGLPGIVPVSFGPAAKALWAGLGGVGVGAGLMNLRNALKKDKVEVVDLTKFERKRPSSKNEDL